MFQIVVLVGFPVSIALLIHSVFAPRSKQEEGNGIGKIRAVFLIAVEFLGVFLVSVIGVGLWGWLLIYGDNPPRWYAEFNRYSALSLAALVSCLTAWRVFTTRATKRYVRIHLWTSLALLILLAASLGARTLDHIDGMSPRSAAENVVERWGREDYEELSLVETNSYPMMTTTIPATDDLKFFTIMGPDEPRGRIMVRRHMKYFWRLSGQETFGTSSKALEEAKDRMNRLGSSTEVIRRKFQKIVVDYPGTPSAIEAQEILDSLDEVEN